MLLTNTPEVIGALSRPISKHISAETLCAYIQEAEDMEVRRAIGDAFYHYLNTNPNKADVDIILNGGEYKDCNGNPCYLNGLRKAIAYYVQAKIIKGNDIQVTRFGAVQKENDYSSRPSSAEKNNLYREMSSLADTYLAEVLGYIKNNKAQYPLCTIGKVRNYRSIYKAIGE